MVVLPQPPFALITAIVRIVAQCRKAFSQSQQQQVHKGSVASLRSTCGRCARPDVLAARIRQARVEQPLLAFLIIPPDLSVVDDPFARRVNLIQTQLDQAIDVVLLVD